MKTLQSLQKYFFFILVSALTAKAQALSPGDIAIVGFYFTNPDQVALVALAEIPNGTEIKITDNGWKSDDTFRANEATITYTATSTLAAGTVFYPTLSSNTYLTDSGDQVLVYRGDDSSPTFIYAMNSEGSSGTWQSDATNTRTSALPTGLTNGTNAIAFPEVDNGYYSGTTTGTAAELLAAISNTDNWTTSNSRMASTLWPTAFTIDGAAPDTTPPTLGSSSPADEATGIASITNVVLTFDEDVQLGASGNIVIKELVGDATFESFDVATTSQITVSGSQVTIDPTSVFSASTGYYLEIDSGAIEDTAGNDYAGISENSTLNFTTSALDYSSLFINEVDPDTPGSDTAEFIELYDGGVGNTDLSGLVIVLYNGGGDTSYEAYDLDGQTTDSNGFFVIGNTAVANVGIVIPSNTIQNGVDAVALHIGSASDYPDGTAASPTNLLDAVVHDDGGANDAVLVEILTPGQSVVSEGGTGVDEANSIARVPDGGTQRITSTYVAQTPTPGASNSASPDTTPPTLGSSSPADEATGIASITNVVLTFDEDVQLGASGNIVIKELVGDATFESFDVATTSQITVSGSQVTIDPTSVFSASTGYYLEIDSGAIEDTAGNDYAGISENSTLNFTTSALDYSSLFINEVDPDTPGSDTAEFIELYDGGVGNTDLSGLVIVLYNGGGDTSYEAYDLDGQTTDSNGFFVIGNTAVANVGIVIPSNTIQNGVDAVALHIGSASDYPDGTAASPTNLLDAVVHDDGGANDAVLVEILTPGQSVVSEGGTGVDEANSIARVPDGGTQRITSTYVAQTPTPGASNSAATDPVAEYLTARSLTSTDLTTDSNGNGFTVLEEYLAGFGDGSGLDAISYGIDNDGTTLALTLTSDSQSEPSGITVVLQATSDLSVDFADVAFTTSVADNGDTTYTRSYTYTETSPPAGGQLFLRLSITTD